MIFQTNINIIQLLTNKLISNVDDFLFLCNKVENHSDPVHVTSELMTNYYIWLVVKDKFQNIYSQWSSIFTRSRKARHIYI